MPVLAMTDIGYAKIMKINRSGPHIRLGDFAVGDGTGYIPDNSDTDLHGNLLLRSKITEIRKNDRGDIICICDITDNSLPGIVGEIGIYLDTGELLGLGILDPPYSKLTPSKLRVYCILLAPGRGKNIPFEPVLIPTISFVRDYKDLPPANIAGVNIYAVINGHCADPYIPVMVTKFGMGDDWAIIGGTQVYRGPISDMDQEDTYSWVKIESTKFDWSKLDYGFLAIVDGTARYQARHIKWNAEEQRFDLIDGGFVVPPLFGKISSIISIWTAPGCCGGSCS